VASLSNWNYDCIFSQGVYGVLREVIVVLKG